MVLAVLNLVILLLALSIQPVKSDPLTLIVPWDFPTIQEAINAANYGDTIIVEYLWESESIVVNKSVSLIGSPLASLWRIVVEADNVSISWFNVGPGSGWWPYGPGIVLDGVSGCHLYQVSVGGINEGCGIVLKSSSNNLIANCSVGGTLVWGGAFLFDSSSNNTIYGNRVYVKWGDASIHLEDSSYNKFMHNYFYIFWAQNGQVAILGNSTANTWDFGYPDGGNFWNDYNGTDLFGGLHQNETGRDGMGDSPYIIDMNNVDHYPLMSPLPWDITSSTHAWRPDGVCDISDVAIVATKFGSHVGDGIYDARADLTGSTYLVKDDKIDIKDIALVALHYGD